MRAQFVWFATAVCLANVACKQDASRSEDAPIVAAASLTHTATVSPGDPARIVVRDVLAMSALELDEAEELDLAFSAADRVGFIHDESPSDPCVGLDLRRLASVAQRVRSLRVSGCQVAVEVGLDAFGEQLDALHLADLVLDDGLVKAIAALPHVRMLTLTRMTATEASLRPLSHLPIEALALNELQLDSAIGQLLDAWPRSLTRVSLSGNWAGYKTMQVLAKASALQSLALVDTRAGNFSLSQLKGLHELREVDLVGSLYTDLTPVYFRELPIQRFRCDCPGLGDGGLRAMRSLVGLRVLELPQSRTTSPGLVSLERLRDLETFVAEGLDPSGPGLVSLAKIGALRRVELSGRLDDPKLTNLERLTQLRHLRLHYDNLDDRAMPQLKALTNLETLDLGHTRVSDDGLVALASISRLRALKLHHTRITHHGLAHIAHLRDLEELELDNTDLVDGGVAYLRELHALRVLRLDNTLITDAALPHLMDLHHLEELNLANTVVSEAGVAALHTMPALEVLGLRGTRVEDAVTSPEREPVPPHHSP